MVFGGKKCQIQKEFGRKALELALELVLSPPAAFREKGPVPGHSGPDAVEVVASGVVVYEAKAVLLLLLLLLHFQRKRWLLAPHMRLLAHCQSSWALEEEDVYLMTFWGLHRLLFLLLLHLLLLLLLFLLQPLGLLLNLRSRCLRRKRRRRRRRNRLPVPCAKFEFFGLFSGGDEIVMVVG
jgi:hypothetical protein